MSEPSRRQILRYGAVAAGAAGGLAIPLSDLVAAHAEALPLADDGGAPSTVPGVSFISGAASHTYNFASFLFLGDVNQTLHGYWATGTVFVGLALPAGSFLAQLDIIGYTGTDATQTWFLGEHVPDRFGPSTLTVSPSIISTAGPQTQATWAPSPWLQLAPGHQYIVSNSLATSATNQIVGVVAQYFPAGAITTITPKRVYDSRPGFPPASGTKAVLANGATRAIDCTVGAAVPAGAHAAVVNVTITDTSAAGFVALFKNGTSWPGNSSINWDHVGTSQASTQIVELDATGRMAAYVNIGCSTDLIVDVVGFLA